MWESSLVAQPAIVTFATPLASSASSNFRKAVPPITPIPQLERSVDFHRFRHQIDKLVRSKFTRPLRRESCVKVVDSVDRSLHGGYARDRCDDRESDAARDTV